MQSAIPRSCVSFLLFLVIFTPYVIAAEQGESQSLTDEQKMVEVSKYFQSEYQEEDYFRTDRLLLTATKHLIELQKAPAVASVITDTEIRNMGAKTLLDVLVRIPGFGITRGFYSVYDIEVRGLKTVRSEKVKLMIDGHPVNHPIWGSGAAWTYENLSLEQVKRIEIIRGPGSALYGADAFCGVINVITRLGESVNGTDITASGGSFNSGRINLIHGKRYGDADVLALFSYSDTGSADLGVTSDLIGQSGHTDDWAQSLETSLKISYHDLTFRSRYLSRRNGPYVGVTNTLNDESRLETDEFMADLYFSHSVTEGLDIHAKTYFDYVETTFQWELFPEGFAFAPLPAFTFAGGVLGTPHFKNRGYGFELGVDFDLTDANIVTLGTVYEKQEQYDVTHHANFNPITGENLGSYMDITSSWNWNQAAEREIRAFFLQDVWEVSNEVNFTAGVRYDHFSDFGDSTNPRLGIVWNPLQQMNIKLLYGKAFRAPNFDEQYSNNNPAAIGNDSLNPEEMETYEMVLDLRPWRRLEMNLSGFHNNFSDKIDLAPTGTPGQFQFQNTGDFTIYGIETEVHYKTDSLELYANHTWQQTKNEDSGAGIPGIPTFRWNLGMNFWVGQYLNGNIHLLHVAERPRAINDARPDMDAYNTVNANFIFSNFFKMLEIRTAIYNVFDEKYAYPAPPGTLLDDYPAPGRSFLFEGRYSF